MVAAAAALVQKVAKLSLKHWSEAARVHERAQELRLHSEELVEQDSLAYLAFVDAVRSAKALHGSARDEAIEEARSRTVEVPLDIVRSASEVVELAHQLASRGNQNLRADAVVAAFLGAAAAESAALLVAVNLEGLDDPRQGEAQALARRASELSRSLRPQGS